MVYITSKQGQKPYEKTRNWKMDNDKTDVIRINDMALEHWSYINGLLEVSLVNETYERDEVIKMIEFHYTTAMVHGWKHAMEVKGGENV